MKKSLLTITLLLTGIVSYAQVVFNVQSPASISGNYDLTYSDPAGGWGSPDLTVPANSVTAELMFVEDGTPGTNAQGNPISREGCNPLINDLTGKIAVIYRNTCEFGTKAFNAQSAGAVAVLIINREDALISMGPGADGASVTIPVAFISNVSGQPIADMLNAGETVTAFLGSKLGLFANDLGLEKTKLLIPSANTNPSLLALNASENSKKLGAKILNYGRDAQSNYSLKATVTFGGNEVYSQMVKPSATLPSGDSAIVFLPNFELSNYPVGKYTLTYTVLLENTDEYDGDNTFTVDFNVASNIYSYAQIDANDSILAPQAYRTSTATTTFQSCVHFQHPKASRTQLEGVYFAASVNAPGILVGQEFIVHVFEWNDVFSDINSPEFNNLTEYNLVEVNTTSYSFTSELENKSVYVPLVDIDLNPVSVPMIDNMRYLVCVETFDLNTYIGYTDLDYDYVFDTLNQPISPIITDAGISIFGFTGSPAASIGLELVPNSTTPIITSNGITDFCEDQSITLSSTATSGNQWKKDGVNISGATQTTLVVTASGTYTVVANGNESEPLVVSVYAYPATPIITASDVTTFCQGGSVVLTSDVSSGNVWSNGESSSSITVTESGSYTVTVYNGVCPTSSTATMVTVNSSPVVEITAPGNTFAVCQGSTLDLTAIGAISYIWGGGETTDMIQVSPTSDTPYSVTGTDVNGCTNTANVTVASLTAIIAAIDASSTAVCIGGSTTLLASNGASYSWSDGVSVIGTTNQLDVTPTQTTTYVVTATLGFCTDDESITITVNQLPTIDAGLDITACQDSVVTLNVTGAVDYSWSNGLIGSGVEYTVTANVVTLIVTGVDANGCSNTDELIINPKPLPSVVFSPSSLSICDTADAVLLNDPTITPSGGTGIYSGNGVSGGMFDPSGLNGGSNIVQYTATVDGCSKSFDYTISVENCSGLSIGEVYENGVSIYPNPVNDKLTIKTENVADYNTAVLNDQLGRLIAKWTISSTNTSLDLSKFAEGNYTLILSGANANIVQKIMIK